MDLPASPVGGYGWTPDGLIFSLADNAVALCDIDDGRCSTTPLDLELTDDDLGPSDSAAW